jgi:hypothetical protein
MLQNLPGPLAVLLRARRQCHRRPGMPQNLPGPLAVLLRRGANAIVALRCCHLNGRFEDYR